MTSTTDERALAYINMYAILGGLTALCDIATEAGAILGRASCSIGFAVKDGPHATLNFVGGRCRLTDGTDESDILLRFPSCDKFNKMIKGEYTPVPVRGLTKVSFLLGKFKKLTDLLEVYLRPTTKHAHHVPCNRSRRRSDRQLRQDRQLQCVKHSRRRDKVRDNRMRKGSSRG